MSEAQVTVERLPQRAMITVRGDLGASVMAKAISSVTGLSVPAVGRCEADETRAVAWMSPDELLVMGPYADLDALQTALRDALSGTHHLVQDVSDARALFAITGPAARDTLAKLCPVDLRPALFDVGTFRRTRLSQVACAFWLKDADQFELVVFSSVADYADAVLQNAARADAPVGHF